VTRPPATRRALAGGIFSLVVAADLVTKRWSAGILATDPVEVVPGFLTFTFVENTGAAFSLLRDAGLFLGSAAVVALGVVGYALSRPRPVLDVVALALIGAGAAGNLVDRVARGPGLFDGPVVDWIRFHGFPVFNVADSAVTVGVVLLFLAEWRRG